ncbi:MAG: hypothetical protein ACI9N1_002274 [Flavobacteriales bacterium]|jgi:hypothetical protein
MKNITTLIIATTLLSSCGETTTTDNKEDKKSTEIQNVSTDTNVETKVVVESDVEIKDVPAIPDVFDYSKIEHYAVFDTKAKLIENFGSENIEDGSTWYGEGSLELQHSVVTNPSNSHIVKYVWSEKDPTKLSMIEVYYEKMNKDYEIIGKQGLSSECGVFTGMTLAQLKEWNGADVEFYGFGWDFGGGVVRKEGSKITDCGISFTMGLDYGDDMSKYNDLSGDVTLSSSDAKVMEAPIFVSQITYMVDSE